MKTIALFNSRGGVGKTTLVFHLAWMMQHLGERVLAVDLDPQADLTARFLDQEQIMELWDRAPPATVFGATRPVFEQSGDIQNLSLQAITDGLALLAGDVALWQCEASLADAWTRCLDNNPALAANAYFVTTTLYRTIETAAHAHAATVVIIDLGPHLSALNRAALLSADFVVTPVLADVFSFRGLHSLGATFGGWREGWKARRQHASVPLGSQLPAGAMQPLGYVFLQHAAHKHKPVPSPLYWIHRFPEAFYSNILDKIPPIGNDPWRLASLRHFHSLSSMAQEARKPIFDLTAADGAIGSHAATVRDAYDAFAALAIEIGTRAGIGQWAAPQPRTRS